MTATTKFAIAATTVAAITAFIADTAEARGFGGGARSFSRPSISRPVFSRPAAFKPLKAPKLANLVRTPRIGPVVGHRPIKVPGGIKNPPKLGPIAGLGPKPPIKVPGGIKNPPKLGPIAGNPGIKLPPHLPGRPIDPGFPPGGNIKNPPVGNPGQMPPNPGNGLVPTAPGSGGMGGGGVSIDVTVATGEGGESQVSAGPACEAFLAKWLETGSKAWKLAYYECTGQL